MFLSGRECGECGSSLIQWEFTEPHCFVCGNNHPGYDVYLRGPVATLLHRINFDPSKYAKRVQILAPSITFLDGIGFLTDSLSTNEPIEHTAETRRLRGFPGY